MATSNDGGNLRSLIYDNDGGSKPKLSVLDQLLIPREKKYVEVPDVETAWSVIRKMQIRGAPLIAIVALLGLAVDLHSNPSVVSKLDGMDDSSVFDFIAGKMDYLNTSRPTAVNLSNALGEARTAMEAALAASDNGSTTTTTTRRHRLCEAVRTYAESMLERDVSDNKSIGSHGADAVLERTNGAKANVVTICNTGSLATAGYGTALGVVRSLAGRGKLESVTALETRPYNQGSRLTAFEIVEEEMPGGRLICDSAAGALMRTQKIDACVVGADRVCSNGDTANKIGTYNLSVIAKAHDVPFYVAAPVTSLDLTLENGDSIPIEKRDAEELISASGAPSGVKCWNPAFDVTPASNIEGIITEVGVVERGENGEFDVKAFVERQGSKKRKLNK